ncbi:MAG: ATP-grasp domain-containing protein [Lactobacillus sp.]|jgi:acetyl-CoA carboxylase biotin carboxylase subunit|nr:ATP-grasp domain-containing protein [Lactobacillus sp.]MCI2034142.1 ATP-grasp domain-containing protein [Lactobacillus sp.]
MFKRILVANRGEIAVRLIQVIHELGASAVAVYSEADASALHVQLADAAVCIGPAKASDSYLHMQNILSAAVLTGAEAIHPGFGFLAESADFAELCAQAGVVFIGPKAQVIRRLGDKAQARTLVQELEVPVIPGSEVVTTLDAALAAAATLGYPVMLKAAAGGGGKGIRQVTSAALLTEAWPLAQTEATAAFGEAGMYLEKVLVGAKHLEVQVLADRQGAVWTLPERDCSLQHHKQKLLEVSPCLSCTPQTRARLQALAERIASGSAYENAGTVEFLVTPDEQVYFMEMNTRIQVEHPVSEMVTGLDLLATQITVAAGQPLPNGTRRWAPNGVAIECRVNAEAPTQDFAPQTGTVTRLEWPLGGAGVRVDRGLRVGDTITPYYDAMLAKLIVHAATPALAWAKMARVLAELEITGVQTNQRFQQGLVQDATIQQGHAAIDYVDRVFIPDWQQKEAASC